MYPPNFDVIIDGRSAVGDSRLTASFSGIDCPLKVEIPLLLPPSKQKMGKTVSLFAKHSRFFVPLILQVHNMKCLKRKCVKTA